MNDTPIYNATREILDNFWSLADKVEELHDSTISESAEKREALLTAMLIESAQSDEVAEYLVKKLKLVPTDSKTPPIFGSWRHEVIGYNVSGKKGTTTDILLKGIPSVIGSHLDIIAADNGIVLEAGRCYEPNSRESHRGLYITMVYLNDAGKQVRYNRLGAIKVAPGDHVHKGHIIGSAGSKNGCVEIDVRRNGRRLDAAEWLGVEVKR